ncbi:MAG: hypothetical protein A2Z68_00910 [Candidatus Nealsonbacteria bacterium RBG_13_38_11]|uniref:HTH deoR-type domain-containing protein n=1 Tax=Candidatus Nealsonbacteria bacterium RBG_13_38_11 TaxID=1801662 RepID=A0A1G2DZV3_9BACT|nr:MAG: hypothetical protein A2Z68_00910 [Candidatus Nealsonbacteria bacterium RBG_13_38_11]
MNKEFLIQLTNKIYRLTLLFPKKEPLRYKMREVAASFLTNPNKEELETLNSLFEVALAQNWVSPSELLMVKEEYFGLASILNTVENPQQTLPVLAKEGIENSQIQIQPQIQSGLPERQARILDFLKENGRAQVWQLKEVMPEVTKRTLRRDFEHLLGIGEIERVGERNNTFYQLKSLTS